MFDFFKIIVCVFLKHNEWYSCATHARNKIASVENKNLINNLKILFEISFEFETLFDLHRLMIISISFFVIKNIDFSIATKYRKFSMFEKSTNVALKKNMSKKNVIFSSNVLIVINDSFAFSWLRFDTLKMFFDLWLCVRAYFAKRQKSFDEIVAFVKIFLKSNFFFENDFLFLVWCFEVFSSNCFNFHCGSFPTTSTRQRHDVGAFLTSVWFRGWWGSSSQYGFFYNCDDCWLNLTSEKIDGGVRRWRLRHGRQAKSSRKNDLLNNNKCIYDKKKLLSWFAFFASRKTKFVESNHFWIVVCLASTWTKWLNNVESISINLYKLYNLRQMSKRKLVTIKKNDFLLFFRELFDCFQHIKD